MSRRQRRRSVGSGFVRQDVPMAIPVAARPRADFRVGISIAAVLLAAALLSSCSGNELSLADRAPTTTEPIVASQKSAPGASPTTPGSTAAPTTAPAGQTPPSSPSSSAPPTAPTTTPAEDPLPGLWLGLGSSINDEHGTQYAAAGRGENVRAPLDDGTGGVIYLRCFGDTLDCAIEHVTEPNGTATKLGVASDLLAVGRFKGHPALVTAWKDPSVEPDATADRSGQFGRIIDLDSGTAVATYNWYGWESGPFVADVENDQFVLCNGAGGICDLTLRAGDGAAADQRFSGVPTAQVSSVALDADGKVATWVTTDLDSGATVARVRQLASGATTSVTLLRPSEPAASTSATDGKWVALLVGDRIRLREIVGGTKRGQLVAPAGVLSISIRKPGKSGTAGQNPL